MKPTNSLSFASSVKMAVRYELAIGLNKGHKTSKIRNVKYTGDKKVKGLRGSRLKNVSLHARLFFVYTDDSTLKFLADPNPPHQVHARLGPRGRWPRSL